MTNPILHPLSRDGRALPADTDHLLANTAAGSLLLLHVPPGDYCYESHVRNEYLICLNGHLVLETDACRTAAGVGEMIEVPAGVRHRFAADCDAVLLTVTQQGT
jgi:uncharacterized cupin superfamily protein